MKIYTDNFDFEEYLKTSSHEAIKANSPMLRRYPAPTMYLLDGKHVYLTSLDLCVDVNDSDMLEKASQKIAQKYQKQIRKNDTSSFALHNMFIYKFDFELLCEIRQNLDDVFYYDPNILIEKMGR